MAGDDQPGGPEPEPEPEPELVRRLRRTVLVVGGLNFAYFFIELGVALAAGSVALLADSVDFLEDTAISLLVFVALDWALRWRALAGKVMTLVILVPASAALWTAAHRFGDPVAPDVLPLVLASIGAIAVNGTAAWLLVGVRHAGGSMSRAAFLSARNDVLVNLSVIAMAAVTAWTGSGWPDLVLGCFIILLAGHSALEVWELSEDERLAARALAGERLD